MHKACPNMAKTAPTGRVDAALQRPPLSGPWHEQACGVHGKVCPRRGQEGTGIAAGAFPNRLLCAGMKASARKRFTSSIVVIPAVRNTAGTETYRLGVVRPATKNAEAGR